MVILAQDTSGRSPARSSQKTTTVMLVIALSAVSILNLAVKTKTAASQITSSSGR
jgi:hypothetical protein